MEGLAWATFVALLGMTYDKISRRLNLSGRFKFGRAVRRDVPSRLCTTSALKRMDCYGADAGTPATAISKAPSRIGSGSCPRM